ncbi:acyl-CoA thioesterase [Metabacillus iocasae]|uniref:Acyl-CoA hydrolase n=1 Tax=Priestia iocasae TaxID=2291674 RepID=A0ABS2R0R0_9BACI|nr:acyl-CoA thioesterase [Metabacillus iocasae]MBM7704817.1 acyl-CoA hydrolase [Metabacillus iocasae]
MEQKIPMQQSKVVQTRLVLPPDTNHMGSIFGGKVLAYIDEVAAISAMKHCRSIVVTASIDSVNFLSPVTVGDVLISEAFVTSTGRTSMEVYVRVKRESWKNGEQTLTTTSFLTMVAVDDQGYPIQVPTVYPETNEEKQLYQSAMERRQKRRT